MAKKVSAQIQIQVVLAFKLVLSLMRYLALLLLPLGKCSGDWVNTLPGVMALGGEPACGQVDSLLSQHILYTKSDPVAWYDRGEAQAIPWHWRPGLRRELCISAGSLDKSVPWQG